MPNQDANLLRGALDLLILRAVTGTERHGFDVLEWIEEHLGGTALVEEGTLYPALHRLEERGLLTSRWGRSQNNRRAKFYAPTGKGRRHLENEGARYGDFSRAVLEALGSPGGAG